MSDPGPNWSVVIPVYNKAPYIETTLRSVLAQTDTDFEVVVVDDGSCDDSLAVIESIADPRIRVYRQANAGVSAARNLGIRMSRGRLVAFLDGDDLHHPQCLERLSLLSEKWPSVGVLAGGYLRVPHEQMADYCFVPLLAYDGTALIENLPSRFLQVGMPFCSSSVAVRREVLDVLSPWFPEGEGMGEDLDLWFRLAELGPIAYTPAALAVYRTSIADSLMGAYKIDELLPVWQRMEARVRSCAMPRALRSDALRLVAEMRVTLARRKLEQGANGDVFRLLARAWRGLCGRRWWVTALAACTGSTRVIRALR